jgi:hypothetical protein
MLGRATWITLRSTVTAKDAGGDIKFDNKRTDEPQSTNVLILGTKLTPGYDEDLSKQFRFTVTRVDPSGKPTTGLDAYTNTVIGSVTNGFSFLIPNLKAGTYYYKITEEYFHEEGWTHDNSEYIVTVIVTGPPMAYTVLYPGSSETIDFVNEYKPPDEYREILPGTGGTGAAPFYIGGILIMFAGVTALRLKKRTKGGRS